MEKRLESTSVINEILADSNISLWQLEIDEGKEPRMYGDASFYEIMGMDSSMSPEDVYRFWFERIGESEKPLVLSCVDELMEYQHSEVEYSWLHPSKGTIYIRCGGKRDSSYNKPNGARLWGSHQDVSSLVGVRKSIEDRLKQSESEIKKLSKANEEKKAILNNISGGVAVIRQEPDGKPYPEFISEGFANMLGMTLEQTWEMYSADLRTGVHPDDKERAIKEISDFNASRKEQDTLTYRLRKGDGRYIWVRNTITKVTGDDGIKRVYCSHYDVTHEIEEQESLRRQYRERLDRHLGTTGPNVLMVGQVNISQNKIVEIIAYSDSVQCENINTPCDELIRKNSIFIPDESDRKNILDIFQQKNIIKAYNAGQKKLEYVCMVRLPNDKTGRYVRYYVSVINDPDTGELMGSISLTDVTEQTMRERIMLNLASAGYDMVLDIDLFSGKQKIMRNWQSGDFSGQICDYYEYLRHAVDNYVCDEDKKKVAYLLDKEWVISKLTESGSFSMTYSLLIAADGKARVKHLTVFATDLRLGRICLARKDVTEAAEEERKSKAALEQALAAAEKASRAKSTFLSSMSHDIRTPMNAIIGFADMIAKEPCNEQLVRSSVEKIQRSGDILLKLINDILDISRIESGKVKLDLGVTNLNDEIENLCVMFRESSKKAGINFSVNTDIKSRYVLCDDIKLSQIMVNILSNAVKFTPQGGEIVFGIVQREEAKNGKADFVFSVKDTGIGMSESFLSHAFEMFERERNTTESGISGTGLGLAIVKKLVDMMGGDICIKSELGKGTEITISLTFAPADASDLKKGAFKSDGNIDFTGKKLLLVEDNDMNREIACGILEELGFAVEQAENGVAAVDKVLHCKECYDVILMDIQMPVMDGYKATSEIRRLEDTRRSGIPIIAMTANAFEEDRQRCIDAGMDGHIGKPIDLKALKSTLEEVLTGK